MRLPWEWLNNCTRGGPTGKVLARRFGGRSNRFGRRGSPKAPDNPPLFPPIRLMLSRPSHIQAPRYPSGPGGHIGFKYVRRLTNTGTAIAPSRVPGLNQGRIGGQAPKDSEGDPQLLGVQTPQSSLQLCFRRGPCLQWLQPPRDEMHQPGIP